MPNLTYSPDGKFLAGGGFSLKPHLWELATGQELNRTEPAQYPCKDVAFSPDGRVLACPIDHTVYLWDVFAQIALQPLKGHRKGVESIAFTPDGKTLVTAAGEFGVTHFWEIATGTEHFLPLEIGQHIYAIAYSPDGQLLALGAYNRDGTIWILDVATGKVIRKLTGPHFQVTSLAFSADGKVLASKFQTQTILWDPATGRELRRFEASNMSVSDAALSPDGKTVADADLLQGLIRLWDVSTGKEERRLEGHQRGAYAVAFSPNGKILASGGARDKTVRLWDLEKGEEFQSMQGHQGWIRFVAFSPDGRNLGLCKKGD